MPKDQYGDWCVPPEDPKLIHSQDPARITDKTLLGTAYYYELLRLMARYARLLDKPRRRRGVRDARRPGERGVPEALLQAARRRLRQRHADLQHPAAVLPDGAREEPRARCSTA